jgi:hypothetical protein
LSCQQMNSPMAKQALEPVPHSWRRYTMRSGGG